MLATIATGIVDTIDPSIPGHTRFGVFIVDLLTFAAFLTIALRAYRIWPLWITALQLLTILAHIANILAPARVTWAFAASIILTSFLMPPILAFATYQRQRRLRIHGEDRPWSRF